MGRQARLASACSWRVPTLARLKTFRNTVVLHPSNYSKLSRSGTKATGSSSGLPPTGSCKWKLEGSLGEHQGRALWLLEISGSSLYSYCYQCQSQVPPRSGHCPACRVCILQRDHHCLLLGRCVGFSNYRPFLCLLFHGAGILLHVTALLSPALGALLRAHSQLHAVVLLLLPWLMLLTGGVSLAQFALAFIADTCVAGALLCGAGLLFHGMLMLRGQTTREWAHGQRLYDLGPWRNVQAALGSRWALVWLWPFLSSPLPGDGITFQTTD